VISLLPRPIKVGIPSAYDAIVTSLLCQERLDKLPRSKKAAYDRGLQCLSGTRQDIFRLIYDWIDSKETGNNVFWLRGAAGSGKSTIASTVAARLDGTSNLLEGLDLGSLGATFFCKRDDNSLNQPSLVFPTIAFRLAHTYPLLKEHILSALSNDPDIGESHIRNQFQQLIVEPLSKLPSDLDVPPVVIIIDAVDECGHECTREPLLQCLRGVSSLPVWFKLLVTSRPEQDIEKYLSELPFGHEVDTLSNHSVSDIRAYTQDRVRALRSERKLRSDWPGDQKFDDLISRAEGLFIWVTLSFKFISTEPSPTKALDLVLAPTGQLHLDALYRTVLVQDLVNPKHLDLIRRILGCVVVTRVPQTLPSLCALLDIEYDEAKWAKDKLASVLPTDSSTAVRVIHPSFLDFLTDRERSREFFIDAVEHHFSLARGCLQVMNSNLRTDICGLEDQSVFNHEIPDLANRLGDCVPEELSYSCQFFIEHLIQTSNQDPDLGLLLRTFIHEHIFHWLEVMSLMGEARKAILAIQEIQKWLSVSNETDGRSFPHYR
jgi:hypothetical protein